MKIQDLINPLSPPPRVSLARHRRKCRICSHPQREAIEAAFLRYRSPLQIVWKFRLPHRQGLYRHARALGLSQRRNRRLASSLDLILENALRFQPSFHDLITAVERRSKIDENFEKIRRPKATSVYYTVDASGRTHPVPPDLQMAIPLAALGAGAPNRYTAELESPVSYSKQTTATHSNRYKFEPVRPQKMRPIQGPPSRQNPSKVGSR